jgi:hypothetical protein
MVFKYKFLWWKDRSRSPLPNPQVLGDLSEGVERSSKVKLTSMEVRKHAG